MLMEQCEESPGCTECINFLVCQSVKQYKECYLFKDNAENINTKIMAFSI
jgi:hypothetical protein